ncbi:MAG: hypothetical protein ABSC08_03960 [Bryobacteraceae bacterium]|jgi:hypothetical protein
MTRRVFAVLFVCLLMCSLAALAADKPDFSGNWKLNVEKSDFGPMPKPEKADYVIAHKDPELNVKQTAVTPMGEMSSDVKILTDGTEFTNTIRGQEVKGTAKWDGKTLVVTQKLEIQGNPITFVQKWTLSDDGKSIAQEVTITTPQGDVSTKAILDKV